MNSPTFRQHSTSRMEQKVSVEDFSALLNQGIQLYNPFTANRAPFPNNQIPPGMINQDLVTLLLRLFWP